MGCGRGRVVVSAGLAASLSHRLRPPYTEGLRLPESYLC